MLKLSLLAATIALAGCDLGPSQPMDPETRAALLGSLIANQPHPYYQQPYVMPVYQNRGFNCMRMGNMLSCN